MGYPMSFRQEGKVPNMQISVSEDGLKADIDVDYRSSKSPQALFNGHLSSANSAVGEPASMVPMEAWDGLLPTTLGRAPMHVEPPLMVPTRPGALRRPTTPAPIPMRERARVAAPIRAGALPELAEVTIGSGPVTTETAAAESPATRHREEAVVS